MKMSKRGQEKRASASFPFPRITRGHKEKNSEEKDSKKSGTESMCSEDASLNLEDKFSGQGVCYKAKLIGVDPVSGPRGDKMCHSSMQRLKALIKEAGSHKQRITLHISFDGVTLKDEKTGDIISSHSIPMISYISRDITDKRAFGFVYGSSDTGHQFYGIKTEKSAVPVMKTIGELFTHVYEAKKRAQSVISGRSSKSSSNENDLGNEREDNFFSSNSMKKEPNSKRINEFDKWNETISVNDPFMEISNLKEVISSVKSASDPYANWESFDNPLDSSHGSFSSKNSTMNDSFGTMRNASLSSGNEANSSNSSTYSRVKSNQIIRLKPPVSTSRRHREEVTPNHSNPSTSSNGVFDRSLSSNSSSKSVQAHPNIGSQNNSSDSSSLFGSKDLFFPPLSSDGTQQEKRLDLPEVGGRMNSQAVPFSRPSEEIKFPESNQSVHSNADSSVTSKQIGESVQKSDDRYAVFSEINSMTCSIFDRNLGETEMNHRLNDNDKFFDSHSVFNNNSNKLFESEFSNTLKGQQQISQVSDANSLSSSSSPAFFVDPIQKMNREELPYEFSSRGERQSFPDFSKGLTTSPAPNPFDATQYRTQTSSSGDFEGTMDPRETRNMSRNSCLSDSHPMNSSNNLFSKGLSPYETMEYTVSGSIHSTQEARPSSSTSIASRNPFLDDFFSHSNDDLFSNSSASTSQKFGDFGSHPAASDCRVPVDSSKEMALSSLFKDLDCSPSSSSQNRDAILYGLSSNLFQPIAQKSNSTSPAAWESPKPGSDLESNRSSKQDTSHIQFNSQSFEPNTFALMSRDPVGFNSANDPFAVDPSVERVASAVSFATDVSNSSASHVARSESVISPSPPPRPPPRPREPDSCSPPPIPPRPHRSIGTNTGELYALPPPLPKKSGVLGGRTVANPFSINPTNNDDDLGPLRQDCDLVGTPTPPLPLPQRKISCKDLSSSSLYIRFSPSCNYTQDPAKVSSMITEQNSSSELNNKQNITQSSNSAFGPFTWDSSSLDNNSEISIKSQCQSNLNSTTSKLGEASNICLISRTNDSCTPSTAFSQPESKDSDGTKLDISALGAPFSSDNFGSTQFSTPLTNQHSVNFNWFPSTERREESQPNSKSSQFANISSIGSSDTSFSQMLSNKNNSDFSVNSTDFSSTSPKNTENSNQDEFSRIEPCSDGICHKASPFTHFDPDHTSPPERNIFKKADDPFADDFFNSS